MATEYLPNQPVVFTDYSQQGLNTDTNQWPVLLQGDDVLCIQQKLIPNGTDLLPCELGTLGNQQYYTFDTLGTGWSAVGEVYTHTGAPTGILESSDVYFDIMQYNWIKVVFEVTAVSGGEVTPFQFNYSNGDTWTGTAVNTLGVHTQYIQALIDFNLPAFLANGDITIENFAIYPIGDCFVNGWNSFSKSDDDSLCSISGGSGTLESGQPVIVDGYYVQVQVTVSNRTAGSIQIKTLTDTSQEVCTGNGTFTRYLHNTSGIDEVLKISKDADFDGCISDIHVYQLDTTGGFMITSTNNVPATDFYDVNSSANPVTIYKDRISWCIAFDSVLRSNVEASLVTGCYKIAYYDTLDSTPVYSTNQISYTTDSWEKTKMFIGTCENEGFNFLFDNAGFSLRQRLPILQINPKYEVDADEYITSQGTRSKSTVRKEKLKTLWVDYIDEVAHDAFSTITNCDTITMDGVDVYFPVNDYEPEWNENQKYNTAQVKLDMKYNPSGLYNKGN